MCGGSIFGGTLSQIPDEMIALDLDEFVQLLRRLNGRTFVRKEYSKLLSPSLYDPDKAKGGSGRGKANITACAGIWLDNDTGAVTPEQLADLLPELRMVAFNTFSTTVTCRKYRIFIPTDKIMTAEAYGIIAKAVIARGAEAHPDHGFDRTKLNAANLFYLPCQAKEPGASFFRDFDDPCRKPLDVVAWVKDAVIKEPVPLPPAFRPEKVNEQAVDDALRQWMQAPHLDNHDHHGFFVLGCRLGRASCNEHQIRAHLEWASIYARLPSKCRKRIDGVIASMKNYGYQI